MTDMNNEGRSLRTAEQESLTGATKGAFFPAFNLCGMYAFNLCVLWQQCNVRECQTLGRLHVGPLAPRRRDHGGGAGRDPSSSLCSPNKGVVLNMCRDTSDVRSFVPLRP